MVYEVPCVLINFCYSAFGSLCIQHALPGRFSFCSSLCLVCCHLYASPLAGFESLVTLSLRPLLLFCLIICLQNMARIFLYFVHCVIPSNLKSTYHIASIQWVFSYWINEWELFTKILWELQGGITDYCRDRVHKLSNQSPFVGYFFKVFHYYNSVI